RGGCRRSWAAARAWGWPAMADAEPRRPGTRSDALGLRLALAFLGVALAAVALLAGLAAAFTAADVSNLTNRQRSNLASAITVAAGAAWDRTNSWAAADLNPVLDLAARTGADVQVRDQAGRIAAVSPQFRKHASSPQLSRPIVVRGQRVGQVVVRFSGTGLGPAHAALRPP